MSDDKPVKKPANQKIDVSAAEYLSNVNGSNYDQRFVSTTTGSNATIHIGGAKLSNDHGDYLSVRGGVFTSWAKNEAYQHATHHYAYTALSAEKTFKLSDDYTVSTKAQGAYFGRDGAIPPDSFLYTQASVTHGKMTVGVNSVVGEHLANNQANLFLGCKNTQVYGGIYNIAPLHTTDGRISLSQDFPINARNKAQLFATAEHGEHGQQRIGGMYQAEFGKGFKARLDLVGTSLPVDHHIANVNIRGETPFVLAPHSEHALRGVISGTAGWVGKTASVDNPSPHMQFVYSAGVSLSTTVFDSKRPAPAR